jgi:shikimate kinase
MGSGKSTVGRALARSLGRTHVDVDAAVEVSAGRTIAEIFADDGEEGFRELESEAIEQALAGEPSVISTGGGIVLAETNRELLGAQETTVVWLDAEIDTLVSRVGDGRRRPLLEGDVRTRLSDTVSARAALYEAVADLRIDTTSLGLDAVVDRIAAELGHEVAT